MFFFVFFSLSAPVVLLGVLLIYYMLWDACLLFLRKNVKKYFNNFKIFAKILYGLTCKDYSVLLVFVGLGFNSQSIPKST